MITILTSIYYEKIGFPVTMFLIADRMGADADSLSREADMNGLRKRLKFLLVDTKKNKR
jgi:hypothetical protein